MNRPKEIKLITFDLDDTLWDNMPTITRAEIDTRKYIEERVGKIEWGDLSVLGKGSKTRLVPMGRFAITAINNWLMEREKILNNTDALFLNSKSLVLHLQEQHY